PYACHRFGLIRKMNPKSLRLGLVAKIDVLIVPQELSLRVELVIAGKDWLLMRIEIGFEGFTKTPGHPSPIGQETARGFRIIEAVALLAVGAVSDGPENRMWRIVHRDFGEGAKALSKRGRVISQHLAVFD